MQFAWGERPSISHTDQPMMRMTAMESGTDETVSFLLFCLKNKPKSAETDLGLMRGAIQTKTVIVKLLDTLREKDYL